VSVGTVNGYGSVVIDGVAYDDRQTAAVAEIEPGRDVAVEALLGQRVEVASDAAGVAKSLRVDAALAGAVTSIVNSTRFIVLGQTVELNPSAGKGPVTQFAGGYQSAADIAIADVVEVHGLIARRGPSIVVQATRVEKKPTLPAYLKVSGLVSGLIGSSGFQLGDLMVDASSAIVLPADAGLANGQLVSVLALPSALGSIGGTPTLTAAQLRIRTLPASKNGATLSGSIASLDTMAHTFQLAGLSVSYANAVVTPAGAALAEGKYVRVRGRPLADGSLATDAVEVRDGTHQPEAQLSGDITAYDATTQTLTIRDVVVDASGAALSGCPMGGLALGLYAQVQGAMAATRVIATSLQCMAEPSGATVERLGTATAVNPAAMSLVLTRSGAPDLTVTWTALTFFRALDPQALQGRAIAVEGTMVNGALVASKIKPSP
ncbi:MAG TPA: DUF5666 domain-containing protein, partial [Albitalea sp.]|nr:DUF5666 domain-containing protein [Albitalea sp.]